jgi:hypothetical protein
MICSVRNNYHAAPASTLNAQPTYTVGSNFDLTSDAFTLNTSLWPKDHAQAAQQWKGKIISGRYGQRHDSKGFVEMAAFIPGQMESAPDFYQRGALPHHNEIAVDGGTRPKEHKLYESAEFKKQSKLRIDAATRHIRLAFQINANKF